MPWGQESYPKQCIADGCESTRFQRGPEGAGAINVRCESGHILWIAPPFDTEVVGFQAPGTDGIYGDPR